MGMALYTVFLVCAAIWGWLIVIFGWPGMPFEFVPHAQDAAPAAPVAPVAPLPDLDIILRHYEKIFGSFAQHANLTLICGVGVVWIVAWMAIRITTAHIENPRVVHHHHGAWEGRELEHRDAPLQLEPPREEARARLPMNRNARSV